MGLLLEDLLAAARMRSEAFAEEDVDLAALAAEAVEEHRLVAEQRDLRLVLHAAGGPTVYADPVALARAVGNLLSNAVRLAPAGTAVVVGVGSRAGWAWLAVRDEGPGIPLEEQERVFERFRRGSATGTEGGSGLGLAIARQIVEGHEGRIGLESTVPGGSTFVIWLPDRAGASPDRLSEPPAGVPA
jgi:signal transduction histidine kinase